MSGDNITITARYGSLRVALTLQKSSLAASSAAFAHLRTVLEGAVPDAIGRVLTCASCAPSPFISPPRR